MVNKTFENLNPSVRWTFFDPAPPRFAAKTKLALRAQTVVFAGAPLRGQGAPKNLQCALPGFDFHIALGFYSNEAEAERSLWAFSGAVYGQ